MYGEIQEPELMCSIPLYRCRDKNIDTNLNDKNIDTNLKDNMQRSIDIAIQFQSLKLANNKNFWKGRIPSATILDQYCPSIGASFVAFPFPNQIVIDGHICSDNLIDNNGNCSYDYSDVNTKDDSLYDNNNQMECPVCAFMKAGPCKDECILWDECIQNINNEKDLGTCFTVTDNMMQCMTKHEYYDILTANMPVNNRNN
jgi:hypothetical protein